MHDSQKKNFVGHFIVSLVAISIFLVNISHSGLWFPDAPSHALNGVFYMDMIEEAGFLHPKTYAERYYVQYPSLTIGMYPPVFYVIEAFFFKVFGVSSLIAKLAVLLFTLAGVNIFFLLCRLWFPVWLSVGGCILYLLQPVTLFGQKNVMLDMPALAISIIALYCLYVGTERDSACALFLAPVFAALSFLTKQNTVFLLPVWFAWIIMRRKWTLLKSWHFIVGVLVGTAIVIPWLMVTLGAGRFYTASVALQSPHVWSTCQYYLRHHLEIISPPFMLLTIVSIILSPKLIKYDSFIFALLWSCSVMLFLSLMDYAEPRYAICLIPALIVLGMQVVYFVREKFASLRHCRAVCVLAMMLLVCLHFNPREVLGGRDIDGFAQVADFVINDSDCVSVIYDGYFNGNFIFHMRARDKERRVFVFRASKVIFSTKMLLKLGYNELVDEPSKFYDLLGSYSIKYIVQEEKDSINTLANRRLRQWVQGPKFELVEKYHVSSWALDGFGDLLVYEYLDYEKKPITHIDLDMPMMGRKISVDLRKKR